MTYLIFKATYQLMKYNQVKRREIDAQGSPA
jgi:hypothetical protein